MNSYNEDESTFWDYLIGFTICMIFGLAPLIIKLIIKLICG